MNLLTLAFIGPQSFKFSLCHVSLKSFASSKHKFVPKSLKITTEENRTDSQRWKRQLVVRHETALVVFLKTSAVSDDSKSSGKLPLHVGARQRLAECNSWKYTSWNAWSQHALNRSNRCLRQSKAGDDKAEAMLDLKQRVGGKSLWMVSACCP